MNSKRNKVLTVIIISIALGLLAMSIAIVFLKNKGNDISKSSYIPNMAGDTLDKKTEKLYNEVANFDLANNYPLTPEEVMYFYNNSFDLLYGGQIKENNCLETILNQQWELYSESIKKINDKTMQLDTFISRVEQIDAKKVKFTGTYQSNPIYLQNNPNVCKINIIRFTEGEENEDLYYNFYLYNNLKNKRWEIIRSEETDSHFIPKKISS